EVVRDRKAVTAVDLDRDLVRSGRELLADLRKPPRIPHLGAVVVRGVFEDEREDPLRHEVAAVDAGERLREDGLHAELERSEGGALMFGPRGISTFAASVSSAGLKMWMSSTYGLSSGASSSSGGSPYSRGSSIRPATIETAATAGEQR